MKFCTITTFICFILFPCAEYAATEDYLNHTLKNLLIDGYTIRPGGGSGAAAHEIVGLLASDEQGNTYEFVITYFGEQQFFPKIGTQCDITYQFADLFPNLKHARYVLLFGDYINDPWSREANGARPPCGCPELPDDAPQHPRKDTSCVGDPLLALGNVYWYRGSDGQRHIMN